MPLSLDDLETMLAGRAERDLENTLKEATETFKANIGFHSAIIRRDDLFGEQEQHELDYFLQVLRGVLKKELRPEWQGAARRRFLAEVDELKARNEALEKELGRFKGADPIGFKPNLAVGPTDNDDEPF